MLAHLKSSSVWEYFKERDEIKWVGAPAGVTDWKACWLLISAICSARPLLGTDSPLATTRPLYFATLPACGFHVLFKRCINLIRPSHFSWRPLRQSGKPWYTQLSHDIGGKAIRARCRGCGWLVKVLVKDVRIIETLQQVVGFFCWIRPFKFSLEILYNLTRLFSR